MTTHGRMTWGLSLLTLFTLGAAFAVISVVQDRYQQQQLDTALLQVARAEAEEASANAFSFSSKPGPAANDVGPLDKYGVIFDESGHALSATQPFDAGTPDLAALSSALDAPFDFSVGALRLRGVVVPMPGHPSRRLLLAASRDDLDGDSRFVRKAMAIALAVSLGWMVGAIGWLVRRNMREYERIASTLHRIATGDVEARVSGQVSDQALRRVGTDIDEIAQKLDRLIGHQRRFITHAAHELRSPLTALHGEIQHALRKERSAAEYRQSLSFALRASHRLKHLADELLELARAERVAAETGPVSLNPVLTDVVESLEPLAKEKGLRLERAPTTPSESRVLAAPSDVGRILSNLLDNAIRHSPVQGVVRLEIEEVATDDAVRIRVRDQGPGVPDGVRERIFEPFHRSPETRATAEGAGLGLAIARELARKHGGDIMVETVGVGTPGACFVVTLPRCSRAASSFEGNARS